jgi:UDP-N-acetylglucosamine acyltransferase
MPKVHPTAEISAECQLHDSVEIGPGVRIMGKVSLAAGVRLIGHCYINGPVSIGERTVVYPYACIGFEPQDVKFKPGMPTAGVVVGADCLIREHVTIHLASKPENPTRIGDRVFMMVSSHVGHDARVDDDVTLVNNAALGGHSHVAARAILGGNCAIHQYCRVGRMAFVSGLSAMSTDTPPFAIAWTRNSLASINLVGMRRSGMPSDHITRVRQAYRETLRKGLSKDQTIATLTRLAEGCPPVGELLEFVRTAKKPIAPYVSNRRVREDGMAD